MSDLKQCSICGSVANELAPSKLSPGEDQERRWPLLAESICVECLALAELEVEHLGFAARSDDE